MVFKETRLWSNLGLEMGLELACYGLRKNGQGGTGSLPNAIVVHPKDYL